MKERTPSGERARIVGTWKLKSYKVIAETGAVSLPYGDEPIGFLHYTADGRMNVIATSSIRRSQTYLPAVAIDQAPQDRQMFAYAGTYSIEPGKLIHHVEVSWDDSWVGTSQVRFYTLRGRRLTITSHVADSTSREVRQYVVEWQGLKNPTRFSPTKKRQRDV